MEIFSQQRGARGSMNLKITVSEDTKLALEQRARERGYSEVSRYVERLISTDLLAARSFDEILDPIRKTFQESALSEDELESLFQEARDGSTSHGANTSS
jgi:hypothetical protein